MTQLNEAEEHLNLAKKYLQEGIESLKDFEKWER